ncbi:MAG: ABC transporter ATP-binding protein [Granulosicoccus sp.]|nr:ABC transporter ATP-binding protein [Granulosicoccus sp.]
MKAEPGVLELSGVNTYYGKAHILNDLSFTIDRGEVVSLLGRNGAGKSTTVKSIMQLVKPESGTVRFEHHQLMRLSAFQVAKLGVGYVPEDRRIFTDLTILENLEVGRQSSRTDGAGWTTERLFDLFPNLAERKNNRGRALSGGEQQMLSIARTLMGNPKLLLLDEPSEGIAPVIVEQMVATVLKLKADGLSILLSEQNMHFARLVSDRAIIIESGHKRFDGSFDELESKPEIRDAYLSV